MAPTKVTAEPSVSLFSLLLSTWGSRLSVSVCAILFFLFCVYPLLPPMSPKGLVIQLRGSVDETNALFREPGRLLLANATDIIIQLTRLEADTCSLERMLLDDQRLSLTSYDSFVFYLCQEKYIWINAYCYRRKINALKNRMEDREGKLRDAVARRSENNKTYGRSKIDPLDTDGHGLKCVPSNLYRQFLFQKTLDYELSIIDILLLHAQKDIHGANLNAAGTTVKTGRLLPLQLRLYYMFMAFATTRSLNVFSAFVMHFWHKLWINLSFNEATDGPGVSGSMMTVKHGLCLEARTQDTRPPDSFKNLVRKAKRSKQLRNLDSTAYTFVVI
ncbi:hypothetical protein IW261DRAFT_1414949 [Armillaria novae-zelandiae]|uniref:Uncharacterized protein n=1 Tax=Armillaria novae-zelandiae TaxID=153914 RepID=A0AA39UH56_9AGAR|nr:hypothetical protein IW261DRAFT_1414949 [Armillaria novae-zelandiae]